MLRNKLGHHAYLAVEDETHLTIGKFLDTLKRTFGPGRSSNYYRGQLSIAYKKPSEHILDYIGRIKDLRTAIMEGDQTNLTRSLTESEISSIDSFVLEAFYEGLPREYRIELRAEGYHGFTNACNKTIIISRRLEREEARNRNMRANRDNTSSPPPRVLQREPASESPNSAGVPGQKICNYCKRFGHLISECRKRQYSAKTNNNNNIHENDSNYPPRNSGNRPEASACGTPRGLGKARPAHHLEELPGPSILSEVTMETSPPLNFDLHPSENEPHSC